MIKIQNLKIHQRAVENSPLLNIPELKIEKGKIVFLIGESGSGKSLMLSSIAGWKKEGLNYSGSIKNTIEKDRESLTYEMLNGTNRQLSKFRKQHLGYIMQQPYAAMNPTMKLGNQILEKRIQPLNTRKHKKQKYDELSELLLELHLNEPERMLNAYPYELSGGQLQRMVVAMALQNQPELVLADEPTSALDIETKEQMISLLVKICREKGISLLISTHELDMVKRFADEVICLKSGQIVYRGEPKIEKITNNHTLSMFKTFDLYYEENQTSIIETPKIKTNTNTNNLLNIKDLSFFYKSNNLVKNGIRNLVFDGLNFKSKEGCRIGIWGKSGSGKSTLAKIISGLETPEHGEILFRNRKYSYGIRESTYPKIQMVFQDPYSSFNPIRTIEKQIMEVAIDKSGKKIKNLLGQFGLNAAMADRFPHQLSGGQLQRFALIRVLLSEPEGLIMDEFVTGLDVHWKLKIIEEVKRYLLSRDLSIWVISHEMRLLHHLCNEIFILKNGRLKLLN